MAKHIIVRNSKPNLAFSGHLISQLREGTNFRNTTYSVYENNNGGYVVSVAHWDGRTSDNSPDGTLLRDAKQVPNYEGALDFFRKNDEIPRLAFDALVEAGIVPHEEV